MNVINMNTSKTDRRTRQRFPTESTDLGIGMLTAESEDGAYEPVAAVPTIPEAREMTAGNLPRRMDSLERGDGLLCPVRYSVWARGYEGDYAVVATIEI
jgi:hypothetical protein